MSLRIVIPAWNEESQIPELMVNLKKVISSLDLPVKVFLVDDGSTDETAEKAEQYKDTIDLKVLTHDVNKGVSEAFRTGFTAAMKDADSSDFIVTMEANRNADPEMIPKMLEFAAQGTELVLASCYAPGGAVIGDPPMRLLLSKGVNTILRIIFPAQGVHTYTSFYRLWSHDLLCEIKAQTDGRFFDQDGFVCMADMLLKARKVKGIQIREIPMILRSDITEAGSKMKVFRTIRGYLGLISSNLL